MTVYIDVILAVNMVINAAILHFTAKVLGFRHSILKVVLAAAIGSLYTLGLFIEEIAVLYLFPWKMLLPITILMIAFGKMQWKKLIVTAVVYYSISFFLGGIVFAYSYFTLSSIEIHEWSSRYFHGVNYQQLLGGGICGCIILHTFARRVLDRVHKQNLYYSMKIIYGNQLVEMIALLDTGNGLYSIAGHKPVVLADFNVIRLLLGNKCAEFFQNTAPTDWVEHLERCTDEKWLSRVEIIPYRRVEGNSFLIGFRPDRIEVLTGDGLIDTADVVIGIYPGHLDQRMEYAAILHPAVLNNVALRR